MVISTRKTLSRRMKKNCEDSTIRQLKRTIVVAEARLLNYVRSISSLKWILEPYPPIADQEAERARGLLSTTHTRI